jgi:Protein of unknown function (DUF3431)
MVIAKYQEDVSWAQGNIRIYDKSNNPLVGSIQLKNTGREADTYLRYIIGNYHNLDDNTVFIQGNPFDHMEIGANLNSIPYTDNVMGLYTCTATEWIDTYPGLHMRRVFSDILGREAPDTLKVVYGAQFIVHKNCILSRPLQFYKRLLSKLSDMNFDNAHYDNEYNPDVLNAWIMERLWLYIFQSNQI